MSKIYCIDCKYLKQKRENYFDHKFIKHGGMGAKWSYKKFLMPQPLCCHKMCFKIVNKEKVRFRGQAQLNINDDCQYYKKKWWISGKKE